MLASRVGEGGQKFMGTPPSAPRPAMGAKFKVLVSPAIDRQHDMLVIFHVVRMLEIYCISVAEFIFILPDKEESHSANLKKDVWNNFIVNPHRDIQVNKSLAQRIGGYSIPGRLGGGGDKRDWLSKTDRGNPEARSL